MIMLTLLPMILYVWIKYRFRDFGLATIPLIFFFPTAIMLAIEIAGRRWRQVQGILLGLAGMSVILFTLMFLIASMFAGTGAGTLAG